MRRIPTALLVLAAILPHGGAAAAVANDAFADPTPIASQPFGVRQDTTGATVEAGEPQPCGNIQATVWFRLTVTEPAQLRASTATSSFDTVLAVYRGSSLGSLELLGCNDDHGSFTSAVRFGADPGDEIHLQAGGFSGKTGSLRLDVTSLANDDFDGAISVEAIPFHDERSTAGAAVEPGEPVASCFVPVATVWYRLVAPADGHAIASTIGSDYDTTLAVYEGTAIDTLDEIACSDDAIGLASEAPFRMTAGRTYHLQIGAFAPDEPGSDLVFDLVPASPPGNDDFAAAEPLQFGSSASSDTTLATVEAGEPAPCGGIGATVWYTVTSDAPGIIEIDTAGSDFDTVLAVYTGGSVSGLQQVSCNDDEAVPLFAGGGFGSSVVFAASPGTVYRVQAGGFAGDTGDLTVTARRLPV